MSDHRRSVSAEDKMTSNHVKSKDHVDLIPSKPRESLDGSFAITYVPTRIKWFSLNLFCQTPATRRAVEQTSQFPVRESARLANGCDNGPDGEWMAYQCTSRSGLTGRLERTRV